MKKYNVLLLGIGFIGKQWIRTINADGRLRLAAVSGILPEGQTVESLGAGDGVRYYPDYREAIEKTDADFVVIAIPTRFHTDAARLALEKGMHVLSEKPLAVDDDDADFAMELVRKYPGLLYAVDQNYRWRAHNRTVRRLLDGGIVGDLREIHIEFRQPDDLNGYRADLEQPLLQDVCIHHFDLLRFFSGKVCKNVYARSYHTPWSVFRDAPRPTFCSRWTAASSSPTRGPGRRTERSRRGTETGLSAVKREFSR
ncbi:MAG: Gfo/Idh/MocA family oxidoreductase [Clostridia bacterium]|nr:Gfo/Idh/MocA family oxidoreductase [Clostridia bacterium]